MKNVMNFFDKQVEKSALFQKRKGSGRKKRQENEVWVIG